MQTRAVFAAAFLFASNAAALAEGGLSCQSKPLLQASSFDAAILPFAVNELTLAANPLKLREYLAAGLPVVSTAIPEAEKLSHVLRIGHNNFGFLDELQNIVEGGKAGPQLSISRQMDTESWDEKVEQLSQILVAL